MSNWGHALRLLKAEMGKAIRDPDAYLARHGEASIVALDIEIRALETPFLQSYPLYKDEE